MVNNVTLVGRIGRAPEIRTLENGTMVGKFSIATSENYKDKVGEWQENTEWHDVVVWRSLAERVQSQLGKGMLIYLTGKLTHRKWQDKDGNNRKTTEVVANYIRKMPGQNNNNNNMPTAADEPARYVADTDPGVAGAKQLTAAGAAAGAGEGSDDQDLPF
jgi:single-strand DNA-binding protein